MGKPKRVWVGGAIATAIATPIIACMFSQRESRWSRQLPMLQQAMPLAFVRQLSSHAGDNYKVLSETFLLHGRPKQVGNQIERTLAIKRVGFRTRLGNNSRLYVIAGKKPERGVIIEVCQNLPTTTYVVIHETADTNLLDDLVLWIQQF